jgi:hypothetical protein
VAEQGPEPLFLKIGFIIEEEALDRVKAAISGVTSETEQRIRNVSEQISKYRTTPDISSGEVQRAVLEIEELTRVTTDISKAAEQFDQQMYALTQQVQTTIEQTKRPPSGEIIETASEVSEARKSLFQGIQEKQEIQNFLSFIDMYMKEAISETGLRFPEQYGHPLVRLLGTEMRKASFEKVAPLAIGQDEVVDFFARISSFVTGGEGYPEDIKTRFSEMINKVAPILDKILYITGTTTPRGEWVSDIAFDITPEDVKSGAYRTFIEFTEFFKETLTKGFMGGEGLGPALENLISNITAEAFTGAGKELAYKGVLRSVDALTTAILPSDVGDLGEQIRDLQGLMRIFFRTPTAEDYVRRTIKRRDPLFIKEDEKTKELALRSRTGIESAKWFWDARFFEDWYDWETEKYYHRLYREHPSMAELIAGESGRFNLYMSNLYMPWSAIEPHGLPEWVDPETYVRRSFGSNQSRQELLWNIEREASLWETMYTEDFDMAGFTPSQINRIANAMIPQTHLLRTWRMLFSGQGRQFGFIEGWPAMALAERARTQPQLHTRGGRFGFDPLYEAGHSFTFLDEISDETKEVVREAEERTRRLMEEGYGPEEPKQETADVLGLTEQSLLEEPKRISIEELKGATIIEYKRIDEKLDKIITMQRTLLQGTEAYGQRWVEESAARPPPKKRIRPSSSGAGQAILDEIDKPGND